MYVQKDSFLYNQPLDAPDVLKKQIWQNPREHPGRDYSGTRVLPIDL